METAPPPSAIMDAAPRHVAPWPVLLVAAAAALVFFSRVGSTPMNDWDEAWHAEVSREILTTGDWLTLHYRGDVYFNKPPLTFWLRALAFRALGVTDFAARLPGACLAWVSVVVLAWFACRRFGALAGAVAGLSLCSSWLFTTYHAGRSGETDGTLICFHVLTFIALWRARRSPGWFYAAGAFTAMGWMTKGGMAYLPWLAAVGAVAMQRGGASPSRWRWRHAAGGFALGVLLAAPWQVAMLLKYGRAFAHAFYVHEAIEPALGVSEGHSASWFLHLWTLEALFQPWLSFAAGTVILAAFAGHRSRPATGWVIAWAAVMLATCTLVRTKILWYVAPAMPPLAILAGVAAAGLVTRRAGWLVLAAAAALATLHVRWPFWITPWDTAAGMALALAAGAGLILLPPTRSRWAVVLASATLAVPLALGGIEVARVIRDGRPPQEWLLLREPDEPWRAFSERVARQFPARMVLLAGLPDRPAAEFYLRRALGDARVRECAEPDCGKLGDEVVIARVETSDAWRARGLEQIFAMEGLAAFVARGAPHPNPSHR